MNFRAEDYEVGEIDETDMDTTKNDRNLFQVCTVWGTHCAAQSILVVHLVSNFQIIKYTKFSILIHI